MFVLIGGVTVMQTLGIGTYASYTFFTLPVFLLMIMMSCMFSENSFMVRIAKSSAVQYISKISFMVYLAQGALPLMKRVLPLGNNWIDIILCTLWILILAVIMQEAFQRNIERWMKKRKQNI